MGYLNSGDTFTPLCCVCHEVAWPTVRIGSYDLYCEPCAALWAKDEDPAPTRQALVEAAVRRAVRVCWPAIYNTWQSDAYTLEVAGYARGRNTVGVRLDREVRYQFRQLLAEEG